LLAKKAKRKNKEQYQEALLHAGVEGKITEYPNGSLCRIFTVEIV